MTDAGVGILALNCPHLLVLRIKGTAVSPTGIATIVHALPRLRAVSVSGPAASDLSLSHISGLRELVDLDLASSMASDAGLLAVAGGRLRGDGGCLKLTAVSLAECPRITGAGLEYLGAGCRSLTTVSLGGLAGAARLVQVAPALAHLAVVAPPLPLTDIDVLCTLLAARPTIDVLLVPVFNTVDVATVLAGVGFRTVTRDETEMPDGRRSFSSWRFADHRLPYTWGGNHGRSNSGFCRVRTPVPADHPWRTQLPALVAG